MNKRYEEYKSTDNKWLPELPQHWVLKRLKHISPSINVGLVINPSTYHDESGAVPMITGRNVTISGIDVTDVSKISSKSNEKLQSTQVYKGDLVAIRVGYPGLTAVIPDELDGINCASLIIVRKSNAVNPFYLSMVMNSPIGTNQVEYVQYGSAQKVFNVGDAADFILPVPPLAEQNIITTFLRNKTAQLDQLVAQKQQMLDLLREERAALINHAVTKGLDATAPLRDSGVEWLGEVPAHWEVKRLKFISPSISVGLVINPSTYYDDNGTIPMISGKHVTENGIDISDVKYITKESNDNLLPSKLNAGDVVSIRVGYPGLTAMVPEELDGINCASLVIIRKGKGFHSPFLVLLMNSPVGTQQVDIVAYGAAQKAFNVGHAIEFIFPLPPVEEQVKIVEQLKFQTDKIAETVRIINQEIALLQEYRAALIAEAVTGQIDVRDYEPVALEVLL